MDRFTAMTVFVRIADTGSFTRAAASLGVSRATVSASLQQLEDRLGVRLLHRTTRRVSLTSEGQRFHERARQVLAKLDEAEQVVRG
ncbi:MAG: LysR family transcriptional regulator, partial [Kofleriaceae bacterium]